jgi:hypothetical protein
MYTGDACICGLSESTKVRESFLFYKYFRYFSGTNPYTKTLGASAKKITTDPTQLLILLHLQKLLNAIT